MYNPHAYQDTTRLWGPITLKKHLNEQKHLRDMVHGFEQAGMYVSAEACRAKLDPPDLQDKLS